MGSDAGCAVATTNPTTPTQMSNSSCNNNLAVTRKVSQNFSSHLGLEPGPLTSAKPSTTDGIGRAIVAGLEPITTIQNPDWS